MQACAGCGALVPEIDGRVHSYVPSSPGCWKTFDEVQADEMQRFGYPPAHRLVVDAYMAQHPGDGSDRRDRQSVFVHLVGLCAVLEGGLAHSHATQVLRRVVQRQDDFPTVKRTRRPGQLSVLHMLGAADAADYERRAGEWATAVWDSWSTQHELIGATLHAVLGGARS